MLEPSPFSPVQIDLGWVRLWDSVARIYAAGMSFAHGAAVCSFICGGHATLLAR